MSSKWSCQKSDRHDFWAENRVLPHFMIDSPATPQKKISGSLKKSSVGHNHTTRLSCPCLMNGILVHKHTVVSLLTSRQEIKIVFTMPDHQYRGAPSCPATPLLCLHTHDHVGRAEALGRRHRLLCQRWMKLDKKKRINDSFYAPEWQTEPSCPITGE